MTLLEAALFLGQAVLFLSLDNLSGPTGCVFLDRLVTITPGNLVEAAGWIYNGQGGLYHDPDRLLDAAMLDKVVLVK